MRLANLQKLNQWSWSSTCIDWSIYKDAARRLIGYEWKERKQLQHEDPVEERTQQQHEGEFIGWVTFEGFMSVAFSKAPFETGAVGVSHQPSVSIPIGDPISCVCVTCAKAVCEPNSRHWSSRESWVPTKQSSRVATKQRSSPAEK